jgi:Epoxide hydrolase N terminus
MMAVERFHIQVSNEVLDDLKYRLEHVRWPDQLEDSGWEQGTEIGYLRSLVSYWRNHFDWRTTTTSLAGGLL